MSNFSSQWSAFGSTFRTTYFSTEFKAYVATDFSTIWATIGTTNSSADRPAYWAANSGPFFVSTNVYKVNFLASSLSTNYGQSNGYCTQYWITRPTSNGVWGTAI